MKLITNLMLILAFCFSGSLISCDDQGANPNDPTQQNWAHLTAATWNVETVMLNDDDVTPIYEGLQIRFNRNGTYVVTNPVDPIWNASGTFQLLTESELILDDNREMTVNEVNGTTLIITFPYEPTGSRMQDVAGNYEFTFSK